MTTELDREIEEAGGHPARRLGDRYLLLGEIAKGGMAVVYRAWDEQLAREVAIKIVATEGPNAPADPAFAERFLREARAAGRLVHPGVVQIYDVEEEPERLFIVMTLVRGGSLAAALRKGLEDREAIQLVADAARGLHHAHEAGIVHRDVKPDNILIDSESGRGVMTDFGLAADHQSDASLTREGMTLGTPAYMSPEQARGQEVGPASDIHALGAVLYRALCGVDPFEGETPAGILVAIVTTKAVPPSERRPDIHGALDLIIRRCLRKDPAKRYATAAALADDLELFLEDPIAVLSKAGLVASTSGRAPGATSPGESAAPAAPSEATPALADEGANERKRRPPVAVVGGVAGAVLLVLTTGLIVALRPRGDSAEGAPSSAVAAGHVDVEMLAPLAGTHTDATVITVEGRLTVGLDGELPGRVLVDDRSIRVDRGGGFLGELPVDDDGERTLEVRLAAGEAPIATVTIVVDRTAPALTLTEPVTDPSVAMQVAFVVRGEVRESSLESVRIRVVGGPEHVVPTDAGGAFEGELRLDATRPGELAELVVTARDRAGNTAELRRSVALDLDAPRIVLDGGAGSGIVTRDPRLVVEGRVVDETSCVLTVGGRAVELDPDGRFAIDVDLAGLPDGAAPGLALEATDGGGRTATEAVAIVVDRTPPELVLDPLALRPVTRADRAVARGSVSDAHGPVEVTVGGVPPIDAGPDGRFEVGVALTEGPNEIVVVAVDALGNETRGSLSVRRDTTPPTITLEELPDEAFGRDRMAAVEGTVDDPDATVTVGDDEVEVEGGAFAKEVRLTEGENEIVVVARDPLGNEASVSVLVRYARRAPPRPKEPAAFLVEGWRMPRRANRTPDFATLGEPEIRARIQQIDHGRRDFEREKLHPGDRPEWFALRVTGFYCATRTGEHEIRLNSDDGSRFYIRDREVIDNDGLHGDRDRRAKVTLKAGVTYPITVTYYNGNGGAGLRLYVTPPGGPEDLLRPSAPR